MKGKDMKKFLIALACCSLSACYYYVPADTYVEDVYTTPGYYGQTTYITPSTSTVYVEQQPDVVYVNNTPDIVYIGSSAPHHHYAPAPHRYHYPEPKHHKAAPQPRHKEITRQPYKPKNTAPEHHAEQQHHGLGKPEKMVNIPNNNHHLTPQKHESHGGKHKK